MWQTYLMIAVLTKENKSIIWYCKPSNLQQFIIYSIIIFKEKASNCIYVDKQVS